MIDFGNLTCYFGAASIEGVSLLPSLLFIFGAYSLYALYALWSRHRRKDLIRVRRGGKSPRLLLVGGALALVCMILLAVAFSPPAPHQTLRCAGVLGGSEPGLIMARAELSPEKLPVANEGQGDRPAYALLHPETPPMLMPGKPASPPGSHRKPKVKPPVKNEVRKSRTASKSPVKEKPANNTRARKVKPKNASKPTMIRHAYSSLMQ